TEKRSLSYYPPTKILVVYHTPAVQAEVAAFLGNIKKALATSSNRSTAKTTKTTELEPNLLPASLFVPQTLRGADSEPLTQPPSLAAPGTARPKHLFHFIIRYEGDGVIDANVVEFL